MKKSAAHTATSASKHVSITGFITNYNEHSMIPLRRKALDIALAGMESVTPWNVVREMLSYDRRKRILGVGTKRLQLGKGRLFVVGAGKGSAMIAHEIEHLIGKQDIEWGAVNDNAPDARPHKIKVNLASHPYPGRRALVATSAMLRKVSHLKEEDNVIAIICGGGSAMLPAPADGITLDDKRRTTDLLLRAGCEVFELNIVRKHLSSVKGGMLAKITHPAKLVSLIFSDTIDSKFDATASGPTMHDTSTFRHAYLVLKKYGLLEKVPRAALRHITEGVKGRREGTLKKGSEYLDPRRVHNIIMVDNKKAVHAMAMDAKKMNISDTTRVDDVLEFRDYISGETGLAAKRLAEQIIKQARKGRSLALVAGGETAVDVKGNGKGGRNQEFAAHMLNNLRPLAQQHGTRFAFLSLATDGADFIKGVGGAIFDESIYSSAGSDSDTSTVTKYIENNDTYHLHQKLGTLLRTKPCSTNVADLFVFVMERK